MRTLRCTLLVLCAALAACSSEPDREWAERTYAARKPAIDSAAATLTAEFAALAPAPSASIPSEPGARAAYAEQLERRKAAFRENVLAALRATPGLLGWNLTYSFPKDESESKIEYSFDGLSRFTPAPKAGTVRAARRDLSVDGRALGWGYFLIPGKGRTTKLGMEAPDYKPGLEVNFTVPQGGAALNAELFFAAPDAEE